jgi:transposase
VQTINTEIATIERRLASALRATEQCKSLAAIPGVGLLTATAAVAAIGQANTFASGREFAAWLGLVPCQTGTGGRVLSLTLNCNSPAWFSRNGSPPTDASR